MLESACKVKCIQVVMKSFVRIRLAAGALGLASLFLSIPRSASSQVMTHCPGSKFYQNPHSAVAVSPEIPGGGIGMVSASDVRNLLNRDPARIHGWMEVFLVTGRGGNPKGPYWMKLDEFKCGKFVGT